MINTNNIKKVYSNKNASKVALNGINMTINKGEIIGLLGPNGSGKTTLIKIISGLLIPDEGTVEISGISLNNSTEKSIMSKIGVVLEGARNLHWRVTVKDNFYYFGSLKGLNKKDINCSIEKFSSTLDIKHLLNRQVKSLSLGEKQKVAIAACLLHNPEIIILDEPSNGLDIESKENLQNTLKHINKDFNTTILITSHDVSFLNNVVDRYIVLYKGIIRDNFERANLTPEGIQERYKDIINSKERKEAI